MAVATVLVMRALGGLAVLIVRGFLLWLLVPLVAVAWAVSYPVARLLGRRVTVGQALGWADLNLIAALQRGLPRSLVAKQAPFLPWRQMRAVRHRIGVADPA